MNKRAAAGSKSSDTNDRTEPLVGSTVVQRIFADAVSAGGSRAATMQWVAELLFPTLLGWHDWAWQRRQGYAAPGGAPPGTNGGSGLLVLGSDDGTLPCEGSTVGLNTSDQHCGSKSATILESGMDNSPMYFNAWRTPADPEGVAADWDAQASRLQLYDVQQTALFAAEAQALQVLANATGNTAAVPQLAQRQATVAAALNSVLWDNNTGIYRQVDASPSARGFSPSLSPTSFYPMISGAASAEQADRMVAGFLTNPAEFCVDPGPGFRATTTTTTTTTFTTTTTTTTTTTATTGTGTCPFALPSISRSDPNFFDNDYWRGRAWGPLNLLTWLGLEHPAYAGVPRVQSARQGLAEQSLRLLLVEFRENRRVHENYNRWVWVGGLG
jgi:putative isomerase